MTYRPLLAVLALAGCLPLADSDQTTRTFDPEQQQPDVVQPLVEQPMEQIDGRTLYQATCSVNLNEGGGVSATMVQTYGTCEEAARKRCGDNGYTIVSSDQSPVSGRENALTTLSYTCNS